MGVSHDISSEREKCVPRGLVFFFYSGSMRAKLRIKMLKEHENSELLSVDGRRRIAFPPLVAFFYFPNVLQ